MTNRQPATSSGNSRINKTERFRVGMGESRDKGGKGGGREGKGRDGKERKEKRGKERKKERN